MGGGIYLLYLEGSLDVGYMLLDVLFQSGDVDGLADLSCHSTCSLAHREGGGSENWETQYSGWQVL
jgi:hypothetical protein